MVSVHVKKKSSAYRNQSELFTGESLINKYAISLVKSHNLFNCAGKTFHVPFALFLLCQTGTVKYPMDTNVKDERNAENTKKHLEKASFLHQVHKGVKGLSPLINLPYFDVIWGFTPDYMHCVLLVVSRHFTEHWLSAVNEPYYIGSPQALSIIDERLCATKPHLCASRLPRFLSVRKYWKASEWQQWLYFSLPCLEGLLPAQFLSIFHLYKALHCCSKTQ